MRNNIKTRDYASLMVIDKALGAREKTAIYESRQMKDLHRAFLTMDHHKFLFSDTSVARSLAMNLEKVKAENLADIYLKTGKECGIVMLSSEYGKLNFQYAILPNHILINVFKGSYTDASRATSEEEFDARFSNVYVGEIVITEDEIKLSAFSVMSILIDSVKTNQSDRLRVAYKDPLYGRQIRYAMKEMKDFPEGVSADLIHENLDPHKHPFLYNEHKRIEAANATLLNALKCFVFLKCAKVYGKTFIEDDTPMTTYRRLRKESNIDYYYVDGHWDSEIKHINPFQVSGHFRNQPKKNEKGEWYKELIYIDSFMKQGYTRKATKDKFEQQNYDKEI